MATNWKAIRDEFPSLQKWTFLNTATFGQLPKRATAAVNRHFAHRDELACSDFVDWYRDADRLRGKIAELIHGEAADIAFIPNTSYALSLLVGGIDWKPGDRIVTLEGEFPNNTYYPAMLESRGVELVEAPWEQFYESVTPNTRLVILSAMSYLNGFRPPAVEIGGFLRERGVLFYLDGTQGCGALGFDMRAIQPDVFAVHGYKWLLSPNGAGFMYVKPQVRKWLKPCVVGWRSDAGWRNVDYLHHGAPQFSETAEQYEGGMLASGLLYAMEASVSMFLEIGPSEIETRVLDLAAKARDVLAARGGEVPSADSPVHRSPIVSGTFPCCDASDVSKRLADARVLVSARHGNLRISTHFYNDENDLDRLDQELRRTLR